LNMNSYRISGLPDSPSSDNDATSKKYVDTSIPVGGIIMWSGTTGTSLPSNWKLCDGSTYNGIKTPDLRGRFVLSSGQGSGGLTNRTVDTIGGVETVALTVEQMPKHKHDVGATTSGNDGDHGHNVTAVNLWEYATPYPGGRSHNVTSVNQARPYDIRADNVASKYKADTNPTGTWHSHAIAVTETEKGSSNAHENMPPFYVLAFIMRIS